MSLLTRLKALLRRLTNSQLNASEFASTLNELAIHIEKDVRDITVETMIELWQAIMEDTPVDLGVAQGNWQLEEKYNSTVLHSDVLAAKEQRQYHLYSGRQVPVPETPQLSNFKDAKNLIIFNNVDYIEELEHGSSPQAPPHAMVGDNVDKFIRIFEQKLIDTGLFK